ncbi:transketolase [Pedobacter sp. MC2016-14]|uniref:transketolase n=1 Tax=Pedobacter sp. MC2016-14 TaxID=2897327 RepID=UPI001E49131C|nr:transketolase [Pedobacter sp. MC2016-14]MCD0489744.1 transketolase [Pedobacter sp. MC2016-14]
MESNTKGIEELAINTVRVLSADAVQKANSGHPGTAMALAPLGHVLWSKFLNYNPKNPDFANRDRFILSAGHACMLQYSFLHLTGYDLSLDDLKNFRQLNSKTAGHPEYGLAPGIDVTTGPLGQGFANGVGFAIGQKHLAARYNRPGYKLFNYNVYAIVSDGDMMEGVTSEAASLAGHLQLGNLIYLYDDNHISIEGSTDITFNEDVSARFRSYGWHVQDLPDANDIHALELALINAKAESQKPSLIRVRSLIAYGSPNKSGTAGSHGSPLGAEELKLVKEFFGFDPELSFHIPKEVAKYYKEKGERGITYEKKWDELFADYRKKYPELAAEYELARDGKLPEGWKDQLPAFKASEPKMATRQASGKVLNAIAGSLPNLIGGAADLSPSTETTLKDFDSFTAENRAGRNFHFGIREHAMGSALNGLALTKGIIPFGATFLMFSEYMRPPIRLAAIMKVSPIFVYTHDSIGLGEDGTTHQPVEQLASLRSIPNVTVIRPADANETAQAWRVAIEKKGGPTVLVFTRQALPVLDQDKFGKATGLEKGAYILSESSSKPELILMATGSEVALILQAQEILEKDGISTRVVSMPSWELFEQQNAAYKEEVFPKAIRKRLAVEMASPMGWHKYTTDEGAILGMTTFGESAPAEDLYKHFGFTPANVVDRAKEVLNK